MAVQACRDCGGNVSTRAKACPHCGRKITRFSLLRVLFALALILVGVPALFVLLVVLLQTPLP
jgi:predicted amidophosphoribosyltransferase